MSVLRRLIGWWRDTRDVVSPACLDRLRAMDMDEPERRWLRQPTGRSAHGAYWRVWEW